MSLAVDLLEQAEHLNNREAAGPPKQASLRRAVSSAYYALFHLLASEAAALAAPSNPPGLRYQVQRALSHEEMKAACNGIRAGAPSQVFRQLAGQPSTFLVRVATAFVDLQEARHQADYDPSMKLSRTEVKLLIQQCRLAFSMWRSVRNTAEGNVFLASLLSQKRWNR